jgi:hypothetical protein
MILTKLILLAIANSLVCLDFSAMHYFIKILINLQNKIKKFSSIEIVFAMQIWAQLSMYMYLKKATIRYLQIILAREAHC